MGNTGSTAVALDGWKLEGAGAFIFPAGTTLTAGAVLVVADVTDAAAFRAAHGIPASVQIFAHTFDLGDAGESVELLKPNNDPLRPMIRAERVRFNDKAPWPLAAAGLGGALERSTCTSYANDPASWLAGNSPGAWGRTVTNPDADSDGLPDAWELTNGLNPADPLDAAADPDGDGADNAFEFAAGTDPQSPASVLHLSAAGYSAAGQALRFPSVSGKTYRIDASDDLSSRQPVSVGIAGSGAEIQITDGAAITSQRRFYRLGVE